MWASEETVGGLHHDLSNAWWTHPGVYEDDIRNVCRLRYDGFFCGAWRAKRYGHPAGCVACGDHWDSWAHAVLRCRHESVQGAITNRHNAMVLQFARGLTKGKHAKSLVMVDAGAAEGDPGRPTIPEWMMTGLDVKPDVVIVEGWPFTNPPPTRPVRFLNGATVCIHLVELTCTSERLIDFRRKEKAEKYAPTVAALRRAGWIVRPEVVTIAMGVRGGVQADILEVLEDLGVKDKKNNMRASNLVKDMQAAVLRGNTKVVKAKRLAESALGGHRSDNRGPYAQPGKRKGPPDGAQQNGRWWKRAKPRPVTKRERSPDGASARQVRQRAARDTARDAAAPRYEARTGTADAGRPTALQVRLTDVRAAAHRARRQGARPAWRLTVRGVQWTDGAGVHRRERDGAAGRAAREVSRLAAEWRAGMRRRAPGRTWHLGG